MSKPKPAAIFDHCQHCGVITVWQYRVDNHDAGAKGRGLPVSGLPVLRPVGRQSCRTSRPGCRQP